MKDMMQVVSRHILLAVLGFLPRERKKRLERWLRGREEYSRLQRADWVLMSWGKSGRTWLRVMLSRFYHNKFAIPGDELLDFDNLKKANPAAPSVFFTHNNYLRNYTGNWHSKAHFDGKPIVLLVRDPRDVAVSQFFQWQYRMRPNKKFINDYPPHGVEITPFQFVMDVQAGLPRVIDYFNGWVETLNARNDVMMVRYEDMRTEPERELSRIIAFTGTPGTEDEVRDAVDFAAYDNMKKLEESRFFKGSGARVKPGDSANPQSFKVRRAKVGGYRDYFSDEECAQLDTLMETLHPVFGYGLSSSITTEISESTDTSENDNGHDLAKQNTGTPTA